MDRTLKTLFALILILLLILPVVNCKKGGGEDNVVEYSPTGLKVIYQRQIPVGIHWADDYLWIKIILICPSQEIYLKVKEETLSRVDPDYFVGYIPVPVALDRVHEVYVKDGALPYIENIESDCRIFTAEGVTIEKGIITEIIRKPGCPIDAPATLARFKIVKQ